MRVLFTPIAVTSTPLLHMVPLAWACRAAGHEVRVAAQPALTAATVATGLPAVEVGHGYDTLAAVVEARGGPRVVEPPLAQWDRSGLARPGPDGPTELAEWRARAQRTLREHAFNPWVEAASDMVPGLVRYAQRWRPHLVVTDPLVFAAPLVSAILGIRLVRYIWGPDMMRQLGLPLQGQPAGGGDARERWPVALVALYDGYGVEPRDDYPTRTVDPWPTSLQLPGTPGRLPMRFVPYNGAAPAPDWVLDKPSRPRVCVTWGTSTAAVGGDEAFILPRIVEALAPLDVDVVLAVSATDRDKLENLPDNLPDNARVAVNLPLHLLMPTCAATVNQAGTSSLLTAACHGVPQVLIPRTADTSINATLFSGSGAALALDAEEATTRTIADAVTTALTDPTVRAAAHKVRDEIHDAPTPAELVRTLECLS